jgi:3-oxoacyl-[acyl-carrier protein] reductase
VGSLTGRIALVTGASRGIGAAVARALHREGAQLALASRTGDDLGLAGAVAGPCDVRDPIQLDRLVAEAAQQLGPLNTIVVCAGVGAYGSFLELSPDDLEEMVDVNVKGTLHTLRAALPHLVAHGGGDVVIVTSGAGRRGMPDRAVYGATKFAQAGLAASLDHELRVHGIRVGIVAPGGTRTDFAIGRGRTPDMPELAGMMAPEEVADSIVFMLTRPPALRVYELDLQPMTERSWG